MDSDQSPQVKGVVIITLPPPDNPSLGKTITAFTVSEFTQSHNTTEPRPEELGHRNQSRHHRMDLPLRSPPNRELQLSFGTLFHGTPRKLFAFLSISLFAVIFYNSLFPEALEKLRRSNDDDDTDSFVFPLFNKFVVYGQRNVQLKLGKSVYVNKENVVAPINDGLGTSKVNKLVSSAADLDSSAILPLRGNVYPDGLYYTYIFVGYPPRPYFLDVDTGSDLTWIQCDAPCTSCAKGRNSLYKPKRGNIVPFKHSLCMEIQSNQNGGHCETCQQCDYEIQYADQSSTMGVLARDELHLVVSNGSLTKPDIVFGCAYDQQGLLLNTLSKLDGILGLSRAKVSLPFQLASQGIIKNVLGHCLNNDAAGGGYMFLGDDFVPQGGMAWVPMLNSPSTSFYQAKVVKLNYGSSPLAVDGWNSGVGRVVFDSGSSYTYFTKQPYSDFVASLEKVSTFGLVQDLTDSTLPMCWRAEFPIRSITEVKQFFKPITILFGSRFWIVSTKFEIPPEGYLIISDKGNVCLGILDGSQVHDGSTIILGDISLRGKLVVYDNMNQKIGWLKSECAKPRRVNSLSFF